MIRINQLEISIDAGDEELEKKILRLLGINQTELEKYYIVRESVDARKKDNIRFSYVIDVKVMNEDKVLKKNPHLTRFEPVIYKLPENGNIKPEHRPVVVGFGPAGIFAGLSLARRGLCPIIIERGPDAFSRKKDVDEFWETGKLKPDSNVSFGEGGAGTFSDGKLNTLVKDKSGRNLEVLRTFVEFGADSSILYLQHPHIGTDKLIEVITSIREEIIRLGGDVRFDTRLENLHFANNRLVSISLSDGSVLECDDLILAIGHSARDTFKLLYSMGIDMEPKSFAVGLRIQHPQDMIDYSQFGDAGVKLGPATYKLTAKASNGRSVYTFCMCPGGYVCDASTEEGRKAVNGMSYHKRDSGTANSALIVSVTPADFTEEASDAPYALSGIEFQRRLERAAYEAGESGIPVQLLGDYLEGRASSCFGDVVPKIKGHYSFARLDKAFPNYIHDSIADVFPELDRRIKGFGRKDAILAGIESRTSSPVRICRDENLQCNFKGIYPCGEGAGYAGGITSAAMDGIRCAEEIIKKYKRWEAQ